MKPPYLNRPTSLLVYVFVPTDYGCAQSIGRTLVCERRSQRPTSGRAWEAYAIVMDKEDNPREAYEARRVAFGFGIGQGGVGAN